MKPDSKLFIPCITSLILISAFFTLPSPSHAGAGHDHGPAPGEGGLATGPVTLSDQSIANLEIKTHPAEIMEMAPSLDLPGSLTVPPNRHASVSAKFEGSILSLLVQLGQEVDEGQPLAELDPVMIGNPPVVLRAPIAGKVSRLPLKKGDAFTPKTVLVEVIDPTVLLARAITYEGPELARIRIGAAAGVLVDMFPDEVIQGTITQITPGLQDREKNFEIYVEIPNSEGKLIPNSQAMVSVPLAAPSTVIAVPKRAVVGDAERKTVFVRDGNTFDRRAVVLGIQAGPLVEIVEGLFPGEEVVTRGNYQLQFASSDPSAAGDDHGHDADNHDDHGGHAHFPWAWLLGGLAVLGILAVVIWWFRKPSRNN